jgi:hypothetical protein
VVTVHQYWTRFKCISFIQKPFYENLICQFHNIERDKANVIKLFRVWNYLFIIYHNEYSFIINIYFYKTFSTQTSSDCTLYHLLDTLSDILDKCFSLIKIESVSINPSQAMLGSLWLGSLLLSVVYTFWLKMLVLVLIKNCNLFEYLIWILSNKLDLNQETRFTIIRRLRTLKVESS